MLNKLLEAFISNRYFYHVADIIRLAYFLNIVLS